MGDSLPFSGSEGKISLALKDPKLLVSGFTSHAEFTHTTLPRCSPQNQERRSLKINRGWKKILSYKVKKAGSHFLLGVGLRVQAFFHNFQELLMDSKDLLDIGEQHLKINTEIKSVTSSCEANLKISI